MVVISRKTKKDRQHNDQKKNGQNGQKDKQLSTQPYAVVFDRRNSRLKCINGATQNMGCDSRFQSDIVLWKTIIVVFN
jgi:hypothetical protein